MIRARVRMTNLWTRSVLLVTIAVALFNSACATPHRQMQPPPASGGKFPITAAIIYPAAMRRKVWQPSIAQQGGVPRPVHPGEVLARTTLEAMSFVFDKVFITESEVGAWSRGANVLCRLVGPCSLIWTPKRYSYNDNRDHSQDPRESSS